MKSIRLKIKKDKSEIEATDLTDITHLEIVGESIKNFSQEFLKQLKNSEVQVLSITSQSDLNFAPLFQDISKLASLTVLKIKANCKNSKELELPKNFAGQMKIITLQGMKLDFCPAFICQLKSLTDLDLSNNDLNSLPENFLQIQTLRRLNLDQNKFSKFPDVLGQLKLLSHLSIDRNNFSESEKARIQREFKIWF